MATQYLIGESGEPLPDGIVLAHTLYGEPANLAALDHTMGRGGLAVIPVGEDGIPYVGPKPATSDPDRLPGREKRCIAKGDSCMGYHMVDSEFCAAHAGLFKGPGREDPEKWAARQAQS
jgi:hypothetical protein